MAAARARPDVMTSYDSILSHVGEFGRYQWWMYSLVCVSAIFHPIHMINFVFWNQEPPFRCAIPGLDNDTYRIQDEAHRHLVNRSIPYDWDLDQLSQCHIYVGNANVLDSVYTSTIYKKVRCFDFVSHGFIGNLSNRTVSCDRWVYDTSEAPNSIVPQFDLVCDRKLLKTHLGMVMMAGLLIGSFGGGAMSDYLGRKFVLVLSLFFLLVLQTAIAFVTSFVAMMVLKCIASAVGLAHFLALFVLVAEVVGPSKRGVTSFATHYTWAFSMGLTPLIFYLCTDWRTAQLVSSVPFVLLLSLWWLIDESPRWLMIHGKPKKAMEIIRKMARRNKVALSDDVRTMTNLRPKLSDDNAKKEKNWMLLCNKGMLVRLVILGVNWGVVTMGYYSFTLNVGDIVQGSIHLNVFLQCLMETGAITLCIFCQTRIGRKPLYSGCIITAGVACLASAVMPLISLENRWVALLLFYVGRFGVSGAFPCVYIATAEMFPTTGRNFGLGLCSLTGRVFGVVTPYIAQLGLLIPGAFGEVFSPMLFGVCAIACGLSIFLLPETRKSTLPNTINDANNTQRDTNTETQEMMCARRSIIPPFLLCFVVMTVVPTDEKGGIPL